MRPHRDPRRVGDLRDFAWDTLRRPLTSVRARAPVLAAARTQTACASTGHVCAAQRIQRHGRWPYQPDGRHLPPDQIQHAAACSVVAQCLEGGLSIRQASRWPAGTPLAALWHFARYLERRAGRLRGAGSQASQRIRRTCSRRAVTCSASAHAGSITGQTGLTCPGKRWESDGHQGTPGPDLSQSLASAGA